MQNFLSQARARNLIHYNVQESTEDIEGCNEYYVAGQDKVPLKYTMAKDEFLCINALSSDFLILGDSLTIEGIANGTKIGPTPNAWGATKGKYKVTATKNTSVTFMSPPKFSSSETEGEPIPGYNVQCILVMKKKYKGTIRSHVKIHQNKFQIYEYQAVMTLHPNATFTLTPKGNAINTGFDGIDGYFLGGAVFPGNYVEGQDFEESVSGDFQVTIDHPLDYFPNNVVELKPYIILSKDTEEFNFGSGLSSGAIAAIVIVVIIVVAVIAGVGFYLWKKKQNQEVTSDTTGVKSDLI